MDRPDRILSRREAAEQLGVHVLTLDRMHAAGTGPKRVRISARRVGYRQSDIAAWLQCRIEN
jgi:predicted DNA-binding transcriptional regulator AlpA